MAFVPPDPNAMIGPVAEQARGRINFSDLSFEQQMAMLGLLAQQGGLGILANDNADVSSLLAQLEGGVQPISRDLAAQGFTDEPVQQQYNQDVDAANTSAANQRAYMEQVGQASQQQQQEALASAAASQQQNLDEVNQQAFLAMLEAQAGDGSGGGGGGGGYGGGGGGRRGGGGGGGGGYGSGDDEFVKPTEGEAKAMHRVQKGFKDFRPQIIDQLSAPTKQGQRIVEEALYGDAHVAQGMKPKRAMEYLTQPQDERGRIKGHLAADFSNVPEINRQLRQAVVNYRAGPDRDPKKKDDNRRVGFSLDEILGSTAQSGFAYRKTDESRDKIDEDIDFLLARGKEEASPEAFGAGEGDFYVNYGLDPYQRNSSIFDDEGNALPSGRDARAWAMMRQEAQKAERKRDQEQRRTANEWRKMQGQQRRAEARKGGPDLAGIERERAMGRRAGPPQRGRNEPVARNTRALSAQPPRRRTVPRQDRRRKSYGR